MNQSGSRATLCLIPLALATLTTHLGCHPSDTGEIGHPTIDATSQPCQRPSAERFTWQADNIEGNHGLIDLQWFMAEDVEKLDLHIQESKLEAKHTLSWQNLAPGDWHLPLAGLLTDQSVQLQMELTLTDGEKRCTAPLILEIPEIDGLDIPQFTPITGHDDGEIITAITFRLEDGQGRSAWYRRGEAIWVIDNDAPDLNARRILYKDEAFTALNEVYIPNDICTLKTFNHQGQLIQSQSLDIPCHHSFDYADLNGDGRDEMLLLGLSQAGKISVNGQNEPIYTDTIEWFDGQNTYPLLDYQSFIQIDDGLLEEMSRVYDPQIMATQSLTYANTLQCHVLKDGQNHCISGLNIAETGLVHIDMQAFRVHIITNQGLMEWNLLERRVQLPKSIPIAWEGLEKLAWNQGAAPDMPFAGMHSAQVIDFNPISQTLTLASHDRGFNILSNLQYDGPTADESCAQTVVYQIDLLNRRGKIQAAHTPLNSDGRCAQSKRTGDLSILNSGDILTSFYTGHAAEEGQAASLPILAAYRYDADHVLESLFQYEAQNLPLVSGFHQSLTFADFQRAPIPINMAPQ